MAPITWAVGDGLFAEYDGLPVSSPEVPIG